MEFKVGNHTSKGENKSADEPRHQIITYHTHPIVCLFLLRKKGEASPPEKMNTNPSTSNEQPFKTPKKFSSNFQLLIKKEI